MKRIISRPFIANKVDGERFITIDNISYKMSDIRPLCSLDEWISKENFARICKVQGFELDNNPQSLAHLGYNDYISTNQDTYGVCFCIKKDYLILSSTKKISSQYVCLIEGVWILEENDLLKKPEEKNDWWKGVLFLLIMTLCVKLMMDYFFK